MFSYVSYIINVCYLCLFSDVVICVFSLLNRFHIVVANSAIGFENKNVSPMSRKRPASGLCIIYKSFCVMFLYHHCLPNFCIFRFYMYFFITFCKGQV